MDNKQRIRSVSSIEVKVVLELTEMEARALNAMTVYGHTQFIEGYYKHLGKSIAPYEEGIKSLFNTIRNELPSHLDKTDKARSVFK